MKALLLAGGFGTRLKPLTDTIPKCLVPIKGEPLLGLWFEKLSAVGVNEFLVNTHYLAPRVEQFVGSSPFKDHIKLVHESTLLGTAGTLKANLSFFEQDDGFLIHADNYCLDSLESMIASHKKRLVDCQLTMLTFKTTTPSSCGIVELDKDHRVVKFHEKLANPPGNLANGAVYLLSSAFIKSFSTRFSNATDFSTEVLPYCLGQILAHETKELFLDIGTPEAYAQVNKP